MATFSLLSLLIGAGLNEAAVEINWPTGWQIETVGCVSTLKSFEADQKEKMLILFRLEECCDRKQLVINGRVFVVFSS